LEVYWCPDVPLLASVWVGILTGHSFFPHEEQHVYWQCSPLLSVRICLSLTHWHLWQVENSHYLQHNLGPNHTGLCAAPLTRSTGRLDRYSTTAVCLASWASCRGVAPSWFLSVTSAPADISCLTTETWPNRAAACRALSPFWNRINDHATSVDSSCDTALCTRCCRPCDSSGS
jgi:hypothetical protein